MNICTQYTHNKICLLLHTNQDTYATDMILKYKHKIVFNLGSVYSVYMILSFTGLNKYSAVIKILMQFLPTTNLLILQQTYCIIVIRLTSVG